MNILLILFLITAFIALYIFLLLPSKTTYEQRNAFQNTNIAHRGLHSRNKVIPENSMSAFRAAKEKGYGIELDIQTSKDGEIVVFHDATLNRVCGVYGRVDEYKYNELKQFKLCNTNEHIPLFSELLKEIDGQVPLIIELKSTKDNKYLCRKTFELLKNYHGTYCIESFNPYIVRWFRINAPSVLRGQLSATVHSLNSGLFAPAAFFLSRLFTNVYSRPNFIAYEKTKLPFSVKLCQKLGAIKAVWTIKPEDKAEKYEAENDIVIFEYYNPKIKY